MSTGRWKHPPGLGASVDAHPLSLMIRQLAGLGMRPAQIQRALAARWWRELRLGWMPPLPSSSTLKRFVRFRLPVEEAESAFQRLARRRYREVTNGGGWVGVAKAPVSGRDKVRLAKAAEAEKARRAGLLVRVQEQRQQFEAAEAYWLALGAAKRR